MLRTSVKNILLLFIGGIVQLLSMAVSVMLGLALFIPITIVVRVFFNKIISQNIFVLLLTWLPFFLIMLIVYGAIWYLMNRWSHKDNFSSLWFNLGAIALNIFLLGFIFIHNTNLFGFLSNWDDDSCGLMPLQFVFLCILYSIILLPAYGWSLQHWILTDLNSHRRKRWVQIIGSISCLLCVLVLITIIVLKK